MLSSSLTPSSPHEFVNRDGEHASDSSQNSPTSTAPTGRSPTHADAVAQALRLWRFSRWESTWSNSSFIGPIGIPPDRFLSIFASSTAYKTVDDIHNHLDPPWLFADLYAEELLEVIKGVDEESAAKQTEGEGRSNLKGKDEKRIKRMNLTVLVCKFVSVRLWCP